MNILPFCVSLLLVLFSSSYGHAAPVQDAIVAIVNNDVITMKDLKDYIGGIYRQLKVENKSPQEINEIMATYEQNGIQQLVEDKLILAAAESKGLEIRPDILQKRIKEIISKYPSEDDFVKVLDGQGLTLGDVKRKLTNQMKARYIVDVEVRDKVFVNPQEVTNYYNKNSNEFTRKAKYTLESIFISYDQGKQEARDKANEARAKLEAGEEFEKVRKEYSQAPSIGSIEQGQMVPAIEDEVFHLNVGEISKVIEVESGIYVFKVTGVLPGRVETLQEVKDQIQAKLYDQMFQKKFNDWIKKLRQKNYVEIRD